MSSKFNDTQLVLLSAASQREDRCLVSPQNAKRGPLEKAVEKILAAGLVKEIKAKVGAPIWRRDEESGQVYSLKLTAAGAKAIAVDAELCAKHDSEQRGDATSVASTAMPEPASTELTASLGMETSLCGSSPTAPRNGTKIAAVIALLQRGTGATLSELVTATGWLPRTTRAALTGLRKRGYAVTIDQSDKARGSLYRIPSAATGEDGVPAAGKEETVVDMTQSKPTAKASPRSRRAA